MELLLEQELLEQLDELLLEGWPPILHNLNHEYKKSLASMLYVGNNSKQELITPEQATKAPYSTGLIIITDRDYIPKMGFLGSTLVPFKGYYRNKDRPNRKKALDWVQNNNGKVYYISPDKEVAKTLAKREARPEDWAPTKKEFQSKEQEKQFKKLIDKYFEKKKEELKNLGPRIKEKLNASLEDRAKKQLEYMKDNTHTYRTKNFLETEDNLTKAIVQLARAINNLSEISVYPHQAYWASDRAIKKRAEHEKHGQTMEYNYDTLTKATQAVSLWTKKLKETLE